jgi:AraC-like DNA-binding protein
MDYRTFVPGPPLADFVDWFWHYEGFCPDHGKERVLPHGAMELVIDLQEGPKRLFEREDHDRFREYRRGWISGAHSEYIVIQATRNSSMMGVRFRPGGAYPLFGFPMTELQDAVVELEAVWGAEAGGLRDQLIGQRGPNQRFAVLEAFLRARLRSAPPCPRVVTAALRAFGGAPHLETVSQVAHHAGLSHKQMIHQFSRWVGLTPKLFCRIRRFQAVLERIEAGRPVDWADLACACGYYDQPHFVHDFTAFSGLNPTRYLLAYDGTFNYIPIRD